MGGAEAQRLLGALLLLSDVLCVAGALGIPRDLFLFDGARLGIEKWEPGFRA